MGGRGRLRSSRRGSRRGTLVASAACVETARERSICRLRRRSPEAPVGARTSGGRAARAQDGADVDRGCVTRSQSRQLIDTLRNRVGSASLFYCRVFAAERVRGDILLEYGMPAAWPVVFESDQAYRLRPGFEIRAEVVSRIRGRAILQSGGCSAKNSSRSGQCDRLRVGRGSVVTMGTR